MSSRACWGRKCGEGKVDTLVRGLLQSSLHSGQEFICMPVDTDKLRGLSPNLSKFLEFEREVEGRLLQEQADRRREAEEEKRQREKRARRKRIKKMRQMQHQ